MGRWTNRIGALAALAGMIAAGPARASCWNDEDVAAAKVRDLQTLLSVVSARCSAAGIEINRDYNAFVEANRNALSASSQRLKARFWTMYGRDEGQRLLDSFSDTLARPYQGVMPYAENCTQVEKLAHEARDSGGSFVALVAVADRNNFTPALPGGACAVKLAALQAAGKN